MGTKPPQGDADRPSLRRDLKQVMVVAGWVALVLSVIALGIPVLVEWARDQLHETAKPWVEIGRVFLATAPLCASVAVIGTAVARGWFRDGIQFVFWTAVCLLLTSVVANQFGLAGSVGSLGELRAKYPNLPKGYWVFSDILAFGYHYWLSYGWQGFLSSVVVGVFLAWIWGCKLFPYFEGKARIKKVSGTDLTEKDRR